ncbi:MAG: hypothetical protein QNK19_05085 [Xanthomonadales bacterium]|nr:hypothetical protein [Xanthomonadales bacterium]
MPKSPSPEASITVSHSGAVFAIEHWFKLHLKADGAEDGLKLHLLYVA